MGQWKNQIFAKGQPVVINSHHGNKGYISKDFPNNNLIRDDRSTI